jgi:undecaprenyl phosphate N,N'-diacetylbacillosamine 1-phosphate transferase
VYRFFIKPFVDWLVSLVILLITVPLWLPLIVLLAITNGGKVLFSQPRPGYQERIFYIFKFKTMTDTRDFDGVLLSDEHRLTPIGKFIRKTSLDELPQLINVLRGEMSIVGPRPLLVEYLPLYNDNERKRHDVKPGITGWAQVNGRNAISWRTKFEYDLWYVQNISFWIDIKILFLTIVKVFKAEGISSVGHVTIEKFNGKN